MQVIRAVKRGDLSSLQKLVEDGLDLNTKDDEDNTA